MKWLVLFAFAGLSPLELNEGCRVACVRSNHTRGHFEKPYCVCEDVIKETYDDFIHNQMKMERVTMKLIED